MRVLVTGISGQVVRSLVERAPAFPWLDVVPVGRPEIDLERLETIAPAVRRIAPDAIVSAAAYTAVDRAEDEPERAMLVNSGAVAELAQAARAAGAPIVHLSTDYVFDGSGTGAYRPDAATGPVGAYGRSKLAGELALHEAGCDHLTVRTAWLYSPFGQNFVRTMLRLAGERDAVSVVADQFGNPTSTLDLADGLIRVLDRWRTGPIGQGSTYHLAGTGTCSWYDFAVEIFRQAGTLGLPAARVRPIPTAEFPTRAKRPANSALDSSRFAQDFGYTMPPWPESLAEVMQRIAAENA